MKSQEEFHYGSLSTEEQRFPSPHEIIFIYLLLSSMGAFASIELNLLNLPLNLKIYHPCLRGLKLII
jgi:hypothetical protein